MYATMLKHLTICGNCTVAPPSMVAKKLVLLCNSFHFWKDLMCYWVFQVFIVRRKGRKAVKTICSAINFQRLPNFFFLPPIRSLIAIIRISIKISSIKIIGRYLWISKDDILNEIRSNCNYVFLEWKSTWWIYDAHNFRRTIIAVFCSEKVKEKPIKM